MWGRYRFDPLGYYMSNGVSPGRERKLLVSLFNGARAMAKNEIAYGQELAMLKYLYSDS